CRFFAFPFVVHEIRRRAGANERWCQMKYLFLLYSEEGGGPAPDSPEGQAIFSAYGKFFEEVNGRGVVLAGGRVQRCESATTVTVPARYTMNAHILWRADGEQVYVFFVLGVADETDAIDLAAMIPAAAHGRVEARPILVFT